MSIGRQIFRRGLASEKALHCGCLECNETYWNKPAVDYSGAYTCGERIEYTKNKHGISEDEACMLVAGKEFAAVCGIGCNPNRCDGRNNPYDVVDEIPPKSGDLRPDTPLYCFPQYDRRKRWVNVWENNFTMEVKETNGSGRCGPGNSFFGADMIHFDETSEELKFEFKKEGGIWKGAEVRLVLPDPEMPFTYGRFEWSVKSIQVFHGDSVVSQTLPPSIVLGLFTWDATENFDVRENFNHEIDIEISQFNTVGGPDVNLLVQPVGLPQHAKFYSGGSIGSYDQSGHKWRFDWNPNNVTWYSDAATGLNHQYSSDDILYYSSPAYVQCLPADVEIRMNLWNVQGVDAPINMTDDMRIEVIVDNFSYQKSGEAHVPFGGSCTKHCQCSADSFCDAGKCSIIPGETTIESSSPSLDATSMTTTTIPPSPSPSPTTKGLPNPSGRACQANPRCRGLSGWCCPTIDDVQLYCCD